MDEIITETIDEVGTPRRRGRLFAASCVLAAGGAIGAGALVSSGAMASDGADPALDSISIVSFDESGDAYECTFSGDDVPDWVAAPVEVFAEVDVEGVVVSSGQATTGAVEVTGDIADGEIVTGDIADGEIVTGDIADGEIVVAGAPVFPAEQARPGTDAECAAMMSTAGDAMIAFGTTEALTAEELPITADEVPTDDAG